jgi:hypothetical protein
MNTIAISYDGQTVALAGRERFWLAAHIQTLPDGHARKRHACLMAVYARDVLTGAMPAPYSDADADHFARLVLDAANCAPSSAPPSPSGDRGVASTSTRPNRRR